MRKFAVLFSVIAGLVSFSAHADVETAKAFAKKYGIIAKNINPEYVGSMPDIGHAFFTRKYFVKGRDVSCSSCHTEDPTKEGKHIITKKKIAPLSPVANPKRFSDLDKIEKNFTDHCNDILGRDCTAQEKVNYIAYLLTVKIDKEGSITPAK